MATWLGIGAASACSGVAFGADFERILGPVKVSKGQVAVQQNPMAVKDGKVYVAHMLAGPSGDRRGLNDLRTVVRMGGTGANGNWIWQDTILEERTVFDPYHNEPAIGVDERGYVHVAYNMHNFPWQYAVSNAPDSIDDFEFRGQAISQRELDRHTYQNKTSFPTIGSAAIPGNQITYPAFDNDRSGKLYVSYRFAAKPKRGFKERTMSAGISRYDAGSRTWTALGGRIGARAGSDFSGKQGDADRVRAITSEQGWTAYSSRLSFGPDGEMTTSSLWRSGTAGATSGRPCAVSTKDGRNFTRVDGKRVSMPLKSRDCGNIKGADASGYYTIGDSTSNAAGHHHVLLSPQGRPRTIHAWNGSKWTEQQSPGNATEIFFDAADNLWALGTGVNPRVKRAGKGKWESIKVGSGSGECYPRAVLDEGGTIAYVHTLKCSGGRASVFRMDLFSLLGEGAPKQPAEPEVQVNALRLPDSGWTQVSLPFESAKMTPRALFGRALPGADYGKTWIMYRYDSSRGQYVDPGVDGRLSAGTGYWMSQLTGRSVSVAPPADARPVSAGTDGRCATALCNTTDIGEAPGEKIWSLGGFPGASVASLSQLRVTSGAGACKDGCSLEAGRAANMIGGKLFLYDNASRGYDELKSGDSINPWNGFWIASLPQASGDLKLLFPAR